MRIIALIDVPEIIERILMHLNVCDPPIRHILHPQRAPDRPPAPSAVRIRPPISTNARIEQPFATLDSS